MSANLIPEQRVVSTAPGGAPLHFTSGQHRLFGWLHWPAAPASTRLGLLICKPFGFESVSSYLSVRAFADAAATLGIPTMRFDYAGTGDAEDLDPQADQVEVWTQDIVGAVEELRRQTGVERVCLLGFRLGALLAALAAPRCEAVSALIAVAPIVSGRRYVREMRNFELAAAQFGNPAAAGGATEARPGSAGCLEVSGFLLSAATLVSLSNIDLAAAGEPPVSDLLVIDRSDLKGARAWSEQLSAKGVRTRYQALPGFVEMMMRPPDLTVVPAAMIAAASDWLQELLSAAPAPRVAVTGGRADSRLEGSSGGMPTECPVFFGSEAQLFGIVTQPPNDETRRRGVVLVNSGGDYHIGPRRMYVSLARRWAQRGYFVLRMDLAGLGDSARRPGRPGNEIFPPRAVEDIRAGVEFMRNRFGVRDITVGGMCSGAFHSLQAAVEGLPVNRILMINPLNFFWEEGAEVSSVQTWEVVHKPAAYRGQVFSAAAWRRVLTGDVNLWRVARIYFHGPWFAFQTRLRDWARRLNIQLRNDLGRELEQIAARGIRIVFVFSQGDAGINLLKVQSGLSLEALSQRYRFRIIDGADHNFTRSGARSVLEQILSEELFARHQ